MQDLWLFARALTSIVNFYVVSLIFDLARVSVTLLLVFLNNSSITIYCRGVRELALLASSI